LSKTVLTEVKGWTPLIDALVQEHGLITAAVFGRMWRYCQLDSGACMASLDKIAGELGLTRQGITPHIQILCKEGYLADENPGRRNKPHTYRDTGKAQIMSTFYADVKHQRSLESSQPAENGVNEVDTGVNGVDTKTENGVNEIDTGVNEIDTRSQQGLHPGVNDVYMKRVFKKQLKIQEEDSGESPKISAPDSLVTGSRRTIQQVWNAALGQVQAEMPKGAYETWVQPCKLIGFDDPHGIFMVATYNDYAQKWCQDRLQSTLSRLLAGYCARPVDVQFIVPEAA
jgi:hypothetical protein